MLNRFKHAMNFEKNHGMALFGVNSLKQGIAKLFVSFDHNHIMARFLEKKLGISPEIAAKDACRIEHIISPETFDSIKAQVEQ